MHISSLASPNGIGTLGKEAREFVDFLKESGGVNTESYRKLETELAKSETKDIKLFSYIEWCSWNAEDDMKATRRKVSYIPLIKTWTHSRMLAN